MPRHESVTDEYVNRLRAGLRAQAVAPNQGWMNADAYPYLLALHQVDQGWSRDQIARDLVTARLRGPFSVIGDNDPSA
jgi:hypothetical protein